MSRTYRELLLTYSIYVLFHNAKNYFTQVFANMLFIIKKKLKTPFRLVLTYMNVVPIRIIKILISVRSSQNETKKLTEEENFFLISARNRKKSFPIQAPLTYIPLVSRERFFLPRRVNIVVMFAGCEHAEQS